MGSPALSYSPPYSANAKTLARLEGQGKFLSGKDRDGDEWSITLTGPGRIIVTDATPGDGVFDDDLDTITIVGSNPNKTYVYGQTAASARVISDGQVLFNHLNAINGAHSIILNGFTLTQTVEAPVAGQPNNVGPEIYIPGGVAYLSFQNIIANIDLAGNGNGPDQPFEIVIGNEFSPLAVRPSIKIGSIFNTVIDSSETSQDGLGPQTSPSVNFLINGNLQNFTSTSATARPVEGGYQFLYPTVDITGQTAIRTNAAHSLKVVASARNLVVSRAGVPFQPQTGQPGIPAATAGTTQPFVSPNSGLRYLRKAQFGGNADAVGIDVAGKIGTLKFYKGLGNPYGTVLNATQLGYNSAQAGYPSRGLLGGLVTAKSIGKVNTAPANLNFQTATDPDVMQKYRKGSTALYARAGAALTNAAIVTKRSIGKVNVVGDAISSQVNSGFDYRSYANGLDPTRSPSKIARYHQRGSLIDSVVAASYRPGPDGIYGTADDVPQTGKIKGKFRGRLYDTGAQSALGYTGVGFFARKKQGYLPPPEA